jgi:hypothetical protein
VKDGVALYGSAKISASFLGRPLTLETKTKENRLRVRTTLTIGQTSIHYEFWLEKLLAYHDAGFHPAEDEQSRMQSAVHAIIDREHRRIIEEEKTISAAAEETLVELENVAFRINDKGESYKKSQETIEQYISRIRQMLETHRTATRAVLGALDELYHTYDIELARYANARNEKQDAEKNGEVAKANLTEQRLAARTFEDQIASDTDLQTWEDMQQQLTNIQNRIRGEEERLLQANMILASPSAMPLKWEDLEKTNTDFSNQSKGLRHVLEHSILEAEKLERTVTRQSVLASARTAAAASARTSSSATAS